MFHVLLGNSRVAERLLASQEGLESMKLVSQFYDDKVAQEASRHLVHTSLIPEYSFRIPL
jgi:hypothetical protein